LAGVKYDEGPADLVRASSIYPILPSRASTSKPSRSEEAGRASR
jgi:hypothetical protein